MHARRFRLDHEGNLHADKLFCRPVCMDPGLGQKAADWRNRRRLEVRAAKATALLAFETAVEQGAMGHALEEASTLHSIMLAQRSANRLSKARVSQRAKAARQTAVPQPALITKC